MRYVLSTNKAFKLRAVLFKIPPYTSLHVTAKRIASLSTKRRSAVWPREKSWPCGGGRGAAGAPGAVSPLSKSPTPLFAHVLSTEEDIPSLPLLAGYVSGFFVKRHLHKRMLHCTVRLYSKWKADERWQSLGW